MVEVGDKILFCVSEFGSDKFYLADMLRIELNSGYEYPYTVLTAPNLMPGFTSGEIAIGASEFIPASIKFKTAALGFTPMCYRDEERTVFI